MKKNLFWFRKNSLKVNTGKFQLNHFPQITGNERKSK